MPVTPIAHPDPSSAGNALLEQAGSLREKIAAAYELTKPRITRMVAVTAGVGFLLGAVEQAWTYPDLFWRGAGCVLGTMIAASGANALNMWWERSRDARMPRTAERPIPSGRVSPLVAAVVGIACSLLGVGILALANGAAPAALAAITVLVYVLAYTPLKPVTTVNTIIGAIPGALPPLIGWAAASTGNHLVSVDGWASLAQPGGWALFLLMFVWQIPHVLALAWMYKDDYAKGGYRMLPITDPTGTRTASTMVLWSFALIGVSLALPLVMPDRLGWLTTLAAGVMGAAFMALCVRVHRKRDRASARAAFFGSIIHLPLLLVVISIDAVLSAVWLKG